MGPKKKHLVVYAFIIVTGFAFAWLFLPGEVTKSVPNNATGNGKDSIIQATLLSEKNNLEDNTEAYASGEKAASGKKSCKLTAALEYGFNLKKNLSDIPGYTGLQTVVVHYKCFMSADPDALYVLAIDEPSGKNLYWDGKPISCEKKNEWCDATIEFRITPDLLKPENKLTLYPWNRNKKEFFVDDIEVLFNGTTVYKKNTPASAGKQNLFFDFETSDGLTNTDCISETTAHSGKRACVLGSDREFGPSVVKKYADLGATPVKRVSLSAWFYPLADAPNTLITVSSVNAKNEAIFWECRTTENLNFPKNKWTKMSGYVLIPSEKLGPDDLITVNIWNKGKTRVIVDDLEIVFGEPERSGTPSTLDPLTRHEHPFVATKNTPPFPVLWLEKEQTWNDDVVKTLHPDDIFLAGNFVNEPDRLDEILCISGARKILFSYDASSKKFIRLWSDLNLDDSIWRNREHFYLSDVNKDKKADVVLVDKDGSWGVVTFNGKDWDIVSKGSKQDKLPAVMIQAVYPNKKMIMSGAFTAEQPQQLVLDRERRFDLKLFQGGDVLANVDFRGYPEDHNPKYYEFVTLLSGHFINSKRNAVLVIMANCADADFNGSRCNSLEDLPYLPNTTQLYAFPE